MMLVDIGDGPVATWMSSSLEYALIQTSASSIGSDAHLARLSELLFVEALRQYLTGLPDSSSGLLVALQDRHLGPAIARMHADPSAHWRVDSLASEAGLSRSAFAERFQTIVGIAPLEYLTRWRMQLAARMLRDTNRTVLSIALEAGYRSDAALIRAFGREFGTTPARWRRAGSGNDHVFARSNQAPTASEASRSTNARIVCGKTPESATGTPTAGTRIHRSRTEAGTICRPPERPPNK